MPSSPSQLTPLVGAEILLGAREAAVEVGLNIDPLLEAHGLDKNLAESPVSFIEKPLLLSFLQAAADLSGRSCFGFLVAKHQPPMKFGPATQLLTLADSIRAALENTAKYVDRYTQGVIFELSEESQGLFFGRTNSYQYHIPPDQLDMLGTAQAFKMLRALSGGVELGKTFVTFKHSAKGESRIFTDFFDCPVLFEQSRTGIFLPDDLLDTPIATANRELLDIVEAYFSMQAPIANRAGDLTQVTNSFIHANLGTSLCTIEACANNLRVHPRTLQRELKKSGATFKNLLLETRIALAKLYLSESDMSQAEICELLGYANISALSRAFSQRLGISPSEWRAERKSRRVAYD